MNEPDIGYLVMERIYDDSGDEYWPQECNPVKFFWDKEKAEEVVTAKTAEALVKLDLYMFGNDLCDVSSKDEKEVVKKLEKLGLCWDGYLNELYIPPMPLEKRIQLVDIFDRIEIFYIEEIEVEE